MALYTLITAYFYLILVYMSGLSIILSPQPAFTLSSRIGYDVRAQVMNLIKSSPLYYLMPSIYPSLYALHALTEQVYTVYEQV